MTTRPVTWRRAVILVLVIPLVLACGGRLPARATAPPELDPDAPFATAAPVEPIEIDLPGALPQAADFLGVTFTVETAHITNAHPYTMFGEPRPGPDLYAVLSLSAENRSGAAVDYRFDDETFALRTWSGREVPVVRHPGVWAFSVLGSGQRAEDEAVFGLNREDELDGAVLLIGRPDDARAAVPLGRAAAEPVLPAPLTAVGSMPVHAGSVDWTIVRGTIGVDAPVGVCCPETGARAGDDERFVTLVVRGVVSGTLYGQTTVSSDQVRLVADGTAIDPLSFVGRANVPEGEAVEFDLHFVTPADVGSLVLRVGVGGDTGEIALEVDG